MRTPPNTTRKGYLPFAPRSVSALEGEIVSIHGFMLPTRVEGGQVRECLIMANQLTCCFSQVPHFCDYIVARINSPVAVLQDQPLVFTGHLHVGDVFEEKSWTAFYSMSMNTVGRPP